MIDITAEVLISTMFIAMFFIVAVLLLAYFALEKKFKWFQKASEQPIKYLLNVDNKKKLKEVLKVTANLSLEEKMTLIHVMFGRPVKFITCLDREGAWLEGVTYYAPEDGADTGWYFERTRDKDHSIG